VELFVILCNHIRDFIGLLARELRGARDSSNMPPSAPASEYSHAVTMQAMRNQVGTKVRNIAHYGQPTIEIHLNGTDGPRNTWVTSYSTMDTLEGIVTITTAQDTRFEDLDIAFVGE
jgi:hypothetical protein